MVDLGDMAFIGIGGTIAQAEQEMVAPAAAGTISGLFGHLQVFRFTDGKLYVDRVRRRNGDQGRRTGCGKGADGDVVDVQFAAERRIDDGIVDVILSGIDLGRIGCDDGLLLLRSRFLVGNGLLRDGILAGQGLVTAQVQLLIGQVGFGLGLGRFGLGQGSVISPAVEAEQRLAFRDFLTALDVFLYDAAGNLRPDGHFVRRRDGTAVLGLDRRVCGDDFIRVDGNRGLGRTLLGTTAGQERGNGENGDAHRRKFAFLYHLHFPPISFDS